MERGSSIGAMDTHPAPTSGPPCPSWLLLPGTRELGDVPVGDLSAARQELGRRSCRLWA